MMPVVHFEIHARKPDEAAKFYSGVFGWSIKKWEGPIDYWLATTKTDNMGIDGAIMLREGAAPVDGAPVNAYVCTVSVDSLDGRIKKVTDNGGKIVVEKREIPGIGWLAYAKDPEGNIFGMLQPNA